MQCLPYVVKMISSIGRINKLAQSLVYLFSMNFKRREETVHAYVCEFAGDGDQANDISSHGIR